MESLSDWARRLKSEIVRNGLKNYDWLIFIIKGSKKDPFLYLGLTALILLGLLSSVPFSNRPNFPILTGRLWQKQGTFLVPGQRIQESPELHFIQKNSLVAVSPPIMVTPQVLGALAEAADYEWAKKEVREYIVEPGDNLWSIAEKFNVSLETLLWANDLNKNSSLQIGQKLVILPVSGVIHHVQKGDSLSEIAKTYKADLSEIIAFNDLIEDGKVYIGDILIIPGGLMPPPPVRYAPASLPLASSYFICPISQPCRITQGLHWYNAIDFDGNCGNPVYAGAEGTVLRARYGWNGGAGNYLTILHPNGVVTFYGHILKSLVSSGDQVSQGQIIALVGGQPGTAGAGVSTGCHLHFGVTGAKNPFAK